MIYHLRDGRAAWQAADVRSPQGQQADPFASGAMFRGAQQREACDAHYREPRLPGQVTIKSTMRSASPFKPRDSFWYLAYQCFFAGWLYLDVTIGSAMQRSIAIRHNVSNRHWLLVYMRRWAMVTALLFSGAAAAESGNLTLACASLYTMGIMAFVVTFIMSVTWSLLCRMAQQPH